MVIDIFHIPAQYFGFTFLINGVGLIVVSQATARLLRHRPAPHLLQWALAAQAFVAAMALLFAWTGWGGIYRPAALAVSLLLPDRSRQPDGRPAWP